MSNWTRDDAKLWAGLIGAVLIALPAHFDMFPWIPEPWQKAIELLAFAIGIVSAKLMTSPLPGKNDSLLDWRDRR